MTSSQQTNLWPGAELQFDRSHAELAQAYRALLNAESLPLELMEHLLGSLYLPLAHWLAEQHHQTPLLVGINGAQGSGKSTISKLIKCVLEQAFNKSVAILSIDDLYHTKSQREQLAQQVHPLLKTRGVPGTHDTVLAESLLQQLKSAEYESLSLPVFDKSIDDRLPEDQWQVLDSPVDIVLFEGWCIGARAQADADLDTPINTLEANEDTEAVWRRYVNQRLSREYSQLFSLLDRLIMLKIPSMQKVFDWRELQEQKLRQQCIESGRDLDDLMDSEALARFIMHYERITRFSLEEMPDRADVVLELNNQHQVEYVSVHRQVDK